MGHYFIKYGEIRGMHGANGFHVLNPKTTKPKITKAYEMTDKSSLINDYRKRTGSPLSNEMLSAMLKLSPKLGDEYYTHSFAKSNASAELEYEKMVWENLRKIIEKSDLEFEINNPKNDTVYNLLQTFLSGSELNFEGYETLRIYKKSIGNRIGEFFSGKSNGETLVMFSKTEVTSIEIKIDHIILKLSKKRMVSIYWNQAYGNK
jgi:hypothetical protein